MVRLRESWSVDHFLPETCNGVGTAGSILGPVLLNFVVSDLEEVVEHTVIKSAANAKLGVAGQYSLWKGCHSEAPRQAGGTGQQEPHEIQGAKCKVLHLGRRSLLQRHRLGTGCIVISSREEALGQQAGLELVASSGSRDG